MNWNDIVTFHQEQNTDFWVGHTWLFVLMMCLFPRLTMLFATTFGGGLLYWVGWFLCPRLIVAVIATVLYSNTNLDMVGLAWIWAILGEIAEKRTRVRVERKK